MDIFRNFQECYDSIRCNFIRKVNIGVNLSVTKCKFKDIIKMWDKKLKPNTEKY